MLRPIALRYPSRARFHLGCPVGSFLGAIVIAAAACALGCSGANATGDQLGRRAAFDLACGEANLEIVPIDERTRGVRGCGKKATYVENCDGAAVDLYGECTWVLNSGPRPE
jgi:hypothetical protein